MRKQQNNYLGYNRSRAAVFSANGKAYIGFEDYVDADFNDVVFEVPGGVTLFEDSIQLDKPLAPGEYKAMAVTTVYGDNGEAQMTTRVPVTLNVAG